LPQNRRFYLGTAVLGKLCRRGLAPGCSRYREGGAGGQPVSRLWLRCPNTAGVWVVGALFCVVSAILLIVVSSGPTGGSDPVDKVTPVAVKATVEGAVRRRGCACSAAAN